MKVGIVFGTRPEIVKLCSVVRTLRVKNIEAILIHTGQHYDFELSLSFLEELALPNPNYHLDIGSGSHATQTSKALVGIEDILKKEKISFVLVQGDTNSTLAGALSAAKLQIPIGHIEAGLRSYDRRMPEETNRILADHCASVLFAPTEIAALNLLSEGISPKKIFITGNTVVDACLENKGLAKKNIPQSHGVKENNYFVLTLHRPESVDNKNTLHELVLAINKISKEYPIIFPVHPRTLSQLKRTGIITKISENVKMIPPTSYLEFLALLIDSKAVLTDSGGIQEEACILKKPCFTLRDNTERPETVEIGANILLGTTFDSIIKKWNTLDIDEFSERVKSIENPFGDGKSSERIVDIIKNFTGLVHSHSFLEKEYPIEKTITIDEAYDQKAVEEFEKTLHTTIYKLYTPRITFPYPNLLLKKGDICVVR